MERYANDDHTTGISSTPMLTSSSKVESRDGNKHQSNGAIAPGKDWSAFFAECDRAPRLNEFHHFFSTTAGGLANQPLMHPQVERDLLPDDELLDRIIRLHEQRRGRFDPHYHASIPYRVEEACRLARAFLLYSQTCSLPMKLYSIGSAEGTMTRVVAELGQGSIKTLACSPNVENYESFLLHGEPPHASFFVGPLHHLTPEMLESRVDLAHFASGFDIIIEDTTFQMYSPNRKDQVEFVLQNLKPGGILLFLAKFRQPDLDEYVRRERQKDQYFKARYFSPGDIKAKEKDVLELMSRNEVTIEDMATVVRQHLKHCFMTWNNGNFYTLAASDSIENLQVFMGGLVKAAVPSDFMYESLPRKLF